MRPLFQSRDRAAPATVETVPTVFPTINGAEIAAVLIGERIAGDFYDSVRVSPERVLIGLLDVSDVQQQNRQLLSTAQEIFRNRGTELFSGPDINESDAMTELCLDINRHLIDVCCGVHTCPAFLACYHEKFGTLCYTNAGHTPALLRDSSGISELASTGLPLGLFSHATSDAPTVGIQSKGALLLVSRGVISCQVRKDGSSGASGIERVKETLQSAPISDAQELCVSILNSVNNFGAHAPICDDRTALALIRTA